MNILINGYYGFDNLGDEAVLLALINQIRAARPDAEITVMSAKPEITAKRYGVDAIHRNDRNLLNRVLAKADLFLSGGGSLIQDVTSWRSPLYYLYIIHLAEAANVKTVIACQGIGPINRNIIRFVTKLILNKVSYITLRDMDSKTYLKEIIGVTEPVTAVAGDPALTIKTETHKRIDAWWEENVSQGKPVLGLALRHTKNNPTDKYNSILRAAENWAKENDGKLLFIPFMKKEDILIAKEMTAKLNNEVDAIILDIKEITPSEMIYLISKLKKLIAMRLHAAIFAAVAKTPTVAVSYDPKVASFCFSVDMPSIDITTVDENLLSEELKNVKAPNEEKISKLKHKTINLITKMITTRFLRIK